MLRSTKPVFQRSLGLLQSSRTAAQRHPRQFGQSVAISLRHRALLPSTQFVARATYSTDKPPPLQVGRDAEDEKRLGEQKLKADPSAVSTTSSVRAVYEPASANADPKPEVSDGLKHDLGIVKDTFSVAHVPKESYVLGLAGTLPYLATSLSTVFLSWNINTTWPTQSTFLNSIMFSPENAHWWLSVVEPIQLGYGAVIISFLGAIHWGLEYAEKKSSHSRTRFRYGLGVAASVAAWPTMFLPIEFALTSQLACFTGLYFADVTATRRGWAPSWYSSYRFVLTAIVGAAITISLIGRAKVGDAKPRLSGLSRKFHETHGEEAWSDKWAKLEAEEKAKIKKEKEEAEKKKKEEEKKQKEEEKKKGGSKKKGEKGKDEQKQGKESEKSEEGEEPQDDNEGGDESKEENKDEGKEEKQPEEKKDDKKGEKKEGGDEQQEGESQDEGKSDDAGDNEKEEKQPEEKKGDDKAEKKDEGKNDKQAEEGESKDKKEKPKKK